MEKLGKISEYEALITFKDEFIEIYKEKIKDLNQQLKAIDKTLDNINQLPILKSKKRLYSMFAITFLSTDLENKYNERERFKKLMTRHDGINSKNNLKQTKLSILPVELARNVPIFDLYAFDKAKHGQKNIVVSCPFHQDRTPSFAINKEKNKFKCFSCGKHGDSIQFIMDLKNISFVEAVRAITNR